MLISISSPSYTSKVATFTLLIALLCNPCLSFGSRTIKDSLNYPSLISTVVPCTDIQFKQAPEFATGSNPKGVATADFDGDGKQDIAAAFSFTTVGFSVLRNLGSGQFAPRVDTTLPPNSDVESIFTQDLDGDGKTDVVLSTTFANKISILKNTSSGLGVISFAPRVEYMVGGEQPRSIAFGDFDGDGSPDVVTANRGSSSISVLRNISAGTSTIVLAPRIDFPTVANVITTADFDGDGKLDIAIGGRDFSRDVRVLRNTSSGIGNINFSASVNYDIPNEATAIVARDFDSDGKLDIAASISLGSNVSVLRNTSSGVGNISFAPRQDFDTGLAPFGAVSADFDGDGKFDIATANNNGNSISVLRNTSSAIGTISFASRQWDFGSGISPYNLALGDFNSDGKPDVVTVNRIGETVSVLMNMGVVGSVDFTARKDYLTPLKAGITNVASGDFDGDGYLDLAASFDEIRNVFRFSVYRNNGSSHFSSRLDFSPVSSPVTAIEPFFISTGDFDNDNRTDVIMVGAWQQGPNTFYGLRVFRNTSSGVGNISFELASYAATFQVPSRVFVVDLDGDGLKDIIATHKQLQYDETALIFRNTSSGNGSISFSQSINFILQGGSKISFADLNLDTKYRTKIDI